MYSVSFAFGSSIRWPWPGAIARSGGRIVRSRSSDARYSAMSPSGGAITTVEPSITWSPEKSSRSSSTR